MSNLRRLVVVALAATGLAGALDGGPRSAIPAGPLAPTGIHDASAGGLLRPWRVFSGTSTVGGYPLGLARNGAGTLVVAWIRTTPGRPTQDVRATTFGNEVVATSIVEGWQQLNGVDLVVGKDGMRAFFSGFRSVRHTDPLAGAIGTSLFTRFGWKLSRDPVVKGEAGAHLAAAIDNLYRPILAWPVNLGVSAHRGLNAEDVWDPVMTWSFGVHYGVDVAVGRSSEDGKIVPFVVWCSTDTNSRGGYDGTHVVEWRGDGERLGNPAAPLADQCDAFQRVAVTSGPAPRRHVFAAFIEDSQGSDYRDRVWVRAVDLTNDRKRVVAEFEWHGIHEEPPDDYRKVAISTDPRNGDVWIAWVSRAPGIGQYRVQVRRLDRDLQPTAMPAKPWLPLPKDTNVARLEISAARCGRLDLVGELQDATGRVRLAQNFMQFPTSRLCEVIGDRR